MWRKSRYCLSKLVKSQRREISFSSATSICARTSRLFLPTRDLPEVQMASNPSHKLMLRGGLIRQSCSGIYHFLPVGQRALDKLTQLVHSTMQSIGAQKMSMPFVIPASLWKRTGRWDTVGHQLFRLKDWRGADYCLGPTHEESVTDLVKQEVMSYRQLPLRLYQLDRKFRDEERPQYGLLRGREFWMKDLYTFDLTPEAALETYHDVCRAYESLLLDQLKLPALKVQAATGDIGGSLSHEYHLPSTIGMDTLVTCKRRLARVLPSRCGVGASGELLGDTCTQSLPNCPQQQHGDCPLSTCSGIEVAHSFLLGTKYSSVFNLSYRNSDGKNRLVEMGCYGIGVSRLLAAALEVGCERGGEDRLVWPRPIAPFHVCVLPFIHDQGDPLMRVAEELCGTLEEICRGEVVLEDRTHLTLGARRRDAEIVGYPITVVIGKKTPRDQYELSIRDEYHWSSHIVSKETLLDRVRTLYTTS